MQLENMPYYHRPCVTTPPDNTVDTTDDAHCQAIISTLLIDDCCGLCHLSNVPVKFGKFEKATPPTAKARALLNDEFSCYAQQVLEFSRAVYSFHRGHFCINHSMSKPALSSLISMGPSWVRPITIPGIHIMPPHLQPCYRSPKPHPRIWWYISNPWLFDPFSTFSNEQNDHTFWQIQATIILQLRLVRLLSIIIAMIHPDHDGRSMKTFSSNLKSNS